MFVMTNDGCQDALRGVCAILTIASSASQSAQILRKKFLVEANQQTSKTFQRIGK